MKNAFQRAAVIAALTLAAHARAEPDHDHADHKQDAGAAHADEVKLTPAAIKQHDVRVVTAAVEQQRATIVAPARVGFDTEAMAHVGSAVSGRVTTVKVRVGDAVKAGDTLLVVESAEFGRAQGEYLQRDTEAGIAEAAVAPMKEAYDRAKKLFDESQGIAFAEVQKRQAEYRAAAGAAASAKAATRAAENVLTLCGLSDDALKRLRENGRVDPRMPVTSPIDGRVIEREVTVGELVSPDKEKLLVVADTSTYWVNADVPETRLGDVGVGSRAEIRVASLPQRALAGEVSRVSAEVDADTRTARLLVVVKNENDAVRPGMFATATIVGRNESGPAVVTVPAEAVQTVEGKTSVFVPVEGEPNTFQPREVKVGKAAGGRVPVLSGVRAGESYVGSGAFILKAELGKSEAGHEH